jgi:hypothetical protein
MLTNKEFSMKMIFLCLFISASVFAQDAQDKSHEEHHPAETKTTETKMEGGMMDMNKMMEMMKECHSMHKDKKMCDQDVMKSCQKSMKEKECKHMMKEMKKNMKQ